MDGLQQLVQTSALPRFRSFYSDFGEVREGDL